MNIFEERFGGACSVEGPSPANKNGKLALTAFGQNLYESFEWPLSLTNLEVSD
jgi:hypothetical protein